MSAQEMLGTSTTVSRNEDGLAAPRANLKCSLCDADGLIYSWVDRGGVLVDIDQRQHLPDRAERSFHTHLRQVRPYIAVCVLGVLRKIHVVS
jgi:hypothetical protein